VSSMPGSVSVPAGPKRGSARRRFLGKIFDDPLVAGILDRLLENVHRIELRGESMRRGPAAGERAPDPEQDPAPRPRRRT
jgi:hypothetical protein